MEKTPGLVAVTKFVRPGSAVYASYINYMDRDEAVHGGEIHPDYSVDLCQYFEHKKLKGYADFFNSSSSFCCGVI